MSPIERTIYLRTQLIINGVINAVLNGVIAYLSFSPRGLISTLEVAIDLQITLAIIGFLVAWLAILGARSKFKGSPPQASRLAGMRLPKSASLRALLLMLALMVAFGGLLIAGAALLSPVGLSNWAYIVFKTLYTGGCAVLAALLAIQSVFIENPLNNEVA